MSLTRYLESLIGNSTRKERGFAEVSTNLATYIHNLTKYRSENNFVWTIKIIMNAPTGWQEC